ncbi:MAG: aminotransferase class I/II-fold pyridoxal phosphate-dependent enzyme [Actinomycetaceae bacterium]|nr:aminotransferase class I/II-fold pyridoxal phosphate-dependent enzyme [Actinomycetaceae bacterium]
MPETSPLELLDAAALRGRGSNKWTVAPTCLGAGVAEMDYGLAPEIRAALHDAIDRAFTGYYPPGLLEDTSLAAREYFADAFGWDLEPEELFLIPTVLTVMREMITKLTPSNSAVIVPTPAYMPFLTIPGQLNRECIQVPSLRAADGRFLLDLQGIARALEQGAGSVILCNPWNPTGQVFTREELQEFDALMERFPHAMVFSDEIHAPILPGLSSADFVSYARVSPGAAARTITATAASKGWNIPGMHCAQVIITDADLLRRARGIFEPLAHDVPPLGALATRTAYREAHEWITAVNTQVAANIQRVRSWAAEQSLPVQCLPISEGDILDDAALQITVPSGTYLTWWEDLSGALGECPAATLREAGLVVNDGKALGAGYEHCFRLNLACSPEVLEEILQVLENAFKGL